MSPDDRKRKLAEMAAHIESDKRTRELERDGRNVFAAFGYVACIRLGEAVTYCAMTDLTHEIEVAEDLLRRPGLWSSP